MEFSSIQESRYVLYLGFVLAIGAGSKCDLNNSYRSVVVGSLGVTAESIILKGQPKELGLTANCKAINEHHFFMLLFCNC